MASTVTSFPGLEVVSPSAHCKSKTGLGTIDSYRVRGLQINAAIALVFIIFQYVPSGICHPSYCKHFTSSRQ